ncbi:YheC/YheD family protein [Metabacillus halosaccharovorans]|uniref:YheC/YheD family endospore coat-associated protein n=1 Tax=Metabacillus halosaccharovorans TaxID=930124 RepID=UPI0034CE2BF5
MIRKTIEITENVTSKLDICEISVGLREHLGLSKNIHSLKISCGMHTVFCPIVFIDEEDLSLSLPAHIFDELHLPHQTLSLQGQLVNPRNLKLGPIIGLLTEIKEKDHHVHFGSIHEFCKELAAYCYTNGCLLYIFSFSSYNKQMMQGYCFHQDKWIKTTVPYPDVVHNRIHSRTLEKSKKFLDLTSDLIENKIPYFNDRFLNKWEVHQILSANEHLLPYLPESQLLESKNMLKSMLTEKKDLFIKPINGSQGKRIFRVKQTDENQYFLDYTTFSGDINKEYQSFEELFKTLYPRLKKEGFLLQETIPLKSYKNRTLDFRFLCHKKDRHQWKVTSAVARVSAEQQFVANLARGGEIYRSKEILQELFGEKEAGHLRKLLAELSIEIVEVICIQAGGEFGEFGIDLSLDENGHPWIIEVNTKPSKSEDDLKSGKVRPSAKSIIQYCIFLYEQK